VLNYDDVIERVSDGFYDGFAPMGDDPYVFVASEFLNSFREREILCHLHGSIHFGYDPEILKYEIVKWDDLSKAAESHNVLRPPTYASGEIADVGPILSGLRKADKLNSVPYAYYHYALNDTLASCPRLVVIGYGGNDTHINFWIRQQKGHWGPQSRIAVVNRVSECEAALKEGLLGQLLTDLAGAPIARWLDQARADSGVSLGSTFALFGDGFPMEGEDLDCLVKFLNS